MKRTTTSCNFFLLWIVFIQFKGIICQTPQQFFRVRPQDKEVAQGGTVIIPCEVSNRQGRVQWTKDGLTLGYDRRLPGFPRYTVQGSDSSGEFSLQITDATLSDDAIYECQVGPALNNKPIRAGARVSVLLPPRKIEIVGISAGSRLKIKENEIVELKCIVHDAKPKAHIVWFRDNSEFVTDNRADEDETGSRDGRVTSSSTIRFRPTSSDNSVTYACEAEHAALLNPPLRSSVLLSVLHPPGPPEISGYIEGETIRLGQYVTLVCSAAGGNPLAEITWYRNGIKVDSSYTTSGRESRNTYSFTATTEDNNARYRCESQNELSPAPQSAEIILSVHFAPSSLDLTGPSEARVNDVVSYECTTANSNPPATIEWVVDNRTISGPTGIFSQTVASPNGGWLTYSNLTVRVHTNDRTKLISCKVMNSEVNDAKTESAILTIIYPPGPPKIQGLEEGEVLTAGNLKRLTCTSIAGNPLATLKWFVGEKELNSVYTARDNYASAEVSFVPKWSDNGAEIRCEATNLAMPTPEVVFRRLDVDFAPDYVKVSAMPEKPRAGYNVTLICETATSRPASSITWWHNGEKLGGAAEKVVEGDHGGQVTVSQLDLTLTAQHHGAVVTCDAFNEIVGKRIHDSITLSVNHKPVFQSDSTTNSVPLQLEEGHKATINMTASANPTDVLYKWTREILNPNVKGTPSVTSPNNPVWTKLEIKQSTSSRDNQRVFYNNGILQIKKVKKEDAGFYTVTASNEEGTAQTSFEIDVLYPPSITAITQRVMVGEGDPAHFECAVSSNPYNPDTIKWERKNYDMSTRTVTTHGAPKDQTNYFENEQVQMDDPKVNVVKTVSHQQRGVVLLTVLNATAEDSGLFWCVANNGIGGKEVRNATYLLVRHKPIIVKSPLTSKAASDLRETARLICEARGVPNVTFIWSKVGSGQAIDGSKYEMTSAAMDPLTWRSEFTIFNVTNTDYGDYECVAKNSEGTARHKVLLDVRSRPDTPSQLQVANVTHKSIHLIWIPGFHGGMDQYFRVRFNSDRDPKVRFHDVYPANTDNDWLQGLEPGSKYTISIMSFNNIGESNYTNQIIARTAIAPKRNDSMSVMAIQPAQADQPEATMNDDAASRSHSGSGSLWWQTSLIVLGVLAAISLVAAAPLCHYSKWRGSATNARQAMAASAQPMLQRLIGSTSTGSTKSATMELYTASSYNETMSGGGETLSSISEKSCISGVNHHNGEFPPQAYLEDNFPYSHSTYLVDPPNSMCYDQNSYHSNGNDIQPSSSTAPLCAYVDDVDNPMSLYSVVHKNRNPAMVQQHQSSGDNSIDEAPMRMQNFEDSESEYANELRKQTYRQNFGDQGGYGITSHRPSTSSSLSYSTLPHNSHTGLIVDSRLPYVGTFHHHNHHQNPKQFQHSTHVHFPLELDLEMSNTPPPPPPVINGAHPVPSHLHIMPNRHSMMIVPTSYGPLEDPTTPIIIQTNGSNTPSVVGNNDGPLCASSPKRSMSAFTTFGQRGGSSLATTPLSPTQKMGPIPTTGHLV